jgi:predicted transglutaminase-like cysteine proteinase
MLRRAFALGVAGCLCTGMKAHAQVSIDPLHAATDRFQRLAHQLWRLRPAERRAAADRLVNQLVDYTPDFELCGRRDCWQTPAETLACGRGDCEDYAIAKYFLLNACHGGGCPRLVYASWAPEARPAERQGHMAVIADAGDGDPLVLDCIDPALQPLSRRTDLRPVFSFDTTGLWRGTGRERVGDAALRLRPWREVLQRWAEQQRSAGLADAIALN